MSASPRCLALTSLITPLASSSHQARGPGSLKGTFYCIIIYIEVQAPRMWVLSFLSGFVPKARHGNCEGAAGNVSGEAVRWDVSWEAVRGPIWMWTWPREGWSTLKTSPAEMGRIYPSGRPVKGPSGAFHVTKSS